MSANKTLTIEYKRTILLVFHFLSFIYIQCNVIACRVWLKVLFLPQSKYTYLRWFWWIWCFHSMLCEQKKEIFSAAAAAVASADSIKLCVILWIEIYVLLIIILVPFVAETNFTLRYLKVQVQHQQQQQRIQSHQSSLQFSPYSVLLYVCCKLRADENVHVFDKW